jgi:hypothetical protein
MDGGVTSLDNLVLLCRRHRRAIHEGGFDVIRHRDGAVTFLRPNGVVLEAVPALPAHSSGVAFLPKAECDPDLGRYALRRGLRYRRALSAACQQSLGRDIGRVLLSAGNARVGDRRLTPEALAPL